MDTPNATIATRTPPKRFQWSIPGLLLVLGVSALVGRAINRIDIPRKLAIARQQSTGLPSPEIEIISPSVESTEHAEQIENTFIAEQIKRETLWQLAKEKTPSTFQRATTMDVPFPNYIPSSQKLKLHNTRALSYAERKQINEYYLRWKWRQGEGASQIDRLMDLYAPDAQIFCAPGKEITRDELRTMIAEMRRAGFFTSAADQAKPRLAQNIGGDEIEFLAYHLYTDDSRNRLWGQRHLVWQKRGDKWLIVRDDFPPCYFVRTTK